MNTVKPCNPRSELAFPHVQVNRGQEFAIEWMGGHPGSNHYFAIMRASDEYLMPQNTEEVFETYLKQAPPEAVERYRSARYHKMHLGFTEKNAPGAASSHSLYTAQGKVKMEPGDEHYIERPEAFYCSLYGIARGSPRSGPDCRQAADMTLYKYPDAHHERDAHAAYSNPAFPWLEAVHKFRQVHKWAHQFDIARFDIPRNGLAHGQYVVQYLWRGYRDCIDIDVRRLGARTGERARRPPTPIRLREMCDRLHSHRRFSPTTSQCPTTAGPCMGTAVAALRRTLAWTTASIRATSGS